MKLFKGGIRKTHRLISQIIGPGNVCKLLTQNHGELVGPCGWKGYLQLARQFKLIWNPRLACQFFLKKLLRVNSKWVILAHTSKSAHCSDLPSLKMHRVLSVQYYCTNNSGLAKSYHQTLITAVLFCVFLNQTKTKSACWKTASTSKSPM